jgi:tetratricopeptide (TPR) repeat protein
VLLLMAGVAAAQPGADTYKRTVFAIQEQIQNGNLDKARALVAEAGRRYPANGGLENLLGVIAIQQGHADEAEKQFSAAIRHSPRLLSAYLNLGRVYLQNAVNDPSTAVKALHIYERALEVEPRNAEANYDAAMLLMHAGSYGQSLGRLLNLEPQDRQNLSVAAVACADEAGLGHAAEAEHQVTSLAARADLTESNVMDTIPTLLAAHRGDLADVLISAVASHQALSATGLRMLGLAQEAEGRLPAAQSTLERAFAVDSSSTAILVDLARVAEARKDYESALGYLARDIDPKDANLPYRFGATCLKMTLLAESRKAFTEAVHMDPGNADYNFALGTVTAFAQDPTEALPYLTKFHELRPADAEGILALGTTYFRAKDFDAASPWLKQAASLTETAATAHYYLGRIAREQGHLDEAADELKRSITLEPNRPDVIAELGQVYVQLKKYADAEKQLNQAIALDADNYAANFGLLQLYARTGDTRREAQSKRFDEVKDKSQEQNREAMRVIEIRPEGDPVKP